MKKDFKQLVDQIQSLAQDFGLPNIPGKNNPGITGEFSLPHNPTTTTKPKPVQQNYHYNPNAGVNVQVASQYMQSVKEMQQEIIELYKAFQSAVYTSKEGAKDFTKGYEPFLKYMLNNYTKQSGNETTQYLSNDPSAAPQARSGEFDSYKNSYVWGMRQLLASLQKVGKHSVKGENTPDGFWGLLTNRALKNIASFVYSMIELEKDLKLKQNIYTAQDLQELQSLIPEDPKNPNLPISNDSLANASKIKDNLVKVKALWNHFKDQVFESKGQFGKFTGMSSGFPATIKSKQISSVADSLKEKVYMPNSQDPKYPKDAEGKPVSPTAKYFELENSPITNIPSNLSFDGKGYSKPVAITYGDISDLTRFKAFLSNNDINIGNKPAVNNLSLALTKIKEKLGAV